MDGIAGKAFMARIDACCRMLICVVDGTESSASVD
jgi:hypothetical protein